MDTQMTATDILAKHQELANENAGLREQIKELENKLRIQAVIEHHHDAYWVRREDGSLDGPFALLPWDREKKLIRMQNTGQGSVSGKGPCFCFSCRDPQQTSYVPMAFLKEHRVPHAEERQPTDPPEPRASRWGIRRDY